MKKKYGVLAAGGTGGHINSALALGEGFKEHDISIHYISGRRHLDFKLYQGKKCQHVRSYPLVGKNIFFILKSFFFNGITFFTLLFKFLLKRPLFVFGAGGYVCGPTLLAAYCLKIPIFILEQNSVIGLTNKLLSRLSRIVFSSFDSVQGLTKSKKIKNYGNPLRPEFFRPHTILPNKRFGILVMGGSLGSKEINELIINWLHHYTLDYSISVIHQTGKNDVPHPPSHERVQYYQTEYLDNIVEAYEKSNLIICRGGASTVSELKVVSKPAIIIPITFHRDQHQVHNAHALKDEVTFSVYIESAKELKENNYLKLQKIISHEYRRHKESHDDKKLISNTAKGESSTTLIINEVLKSVSG